MIAPGCSVASVPCKRVGPALSSPIITLQPPPVPFSPPTPTGACASSVATGCITATSRSQRAGKYETIGNR